MLVVSIWQRVIWQPSQLVAHGEIEHIIDIIIYTILCILIIIYSSITVSMTCLSLWWENRVLCKILKFPIKRISVHFELLGFSLGGPTILTERVWEMNKGILGDRFSIGCLIDQNDSYMNELGLFSKAKAQAISSSFPFHTHRRRL